MDDHHLVGLAPRKRISDFTEDYVASGDLQAPDVGGITDFLPARTPFQKVLLISPYQAILTALTSCRVEQCSKQFTPPGIPPDPLSIVRYGAGPHWHCQTQHTPEASNRRTPASRVLQSLSAASTFFKNVASLQLSSESVTGHQISVRMSKLAAVSGNAVQQLEFLEASRCSPEPTRVGAMSSEVPPT